MGRQDNNFIPKGNLQGLPCPETELLSRQEQQSLEHFQPSTSVFVWFFQVFLAGAGWQLLLQEKQGATVPRGSRVWSHPGPAIMDLGIIILPWSSKQLQKVSKPFPRRAGSSPRIQRHVRVSLDLWKALPHTGNLELFHPSTFGATSHPLGSAGAHGMFWKQRTFHVGKPWGALRALGRSWMDKPMDQDGKGSQLEP